MQVIAGAFVGYIILFICSKFKMAGVMRFKMAAKICFYVPK